MDNLSEQSCVPCHGNVSPVSEQEIAQYKPLIPEWELMRQQDSPYLQRRYQLPNFKVALNFAQKVGEIAEQQGHHPTLIVEWGKLTVQWWTHAINGLHRNDFIMAAKTDNMFEAFRK